MEKFGEKFLSNGNVLFIDTASDNISACLAQNGKIICSMSKQGGALENMFGILNEIFAAASLNARDVSAFGFCQGVGSILGIRTASAALSTFRAANKNSVCFAWNLLKTYAQILKASRSEFAILCPSRKNFSNLLAFENGKTIEKEIASSEIQGIKLPKYFVEQRKSADKNFENLERVFFNATEIAEFLLENEDFAYVCEPSEILDAAVLAKREYVKWNSPAHS